MHNMLIIATNHLSMFSVSTRHRDPNWPAPSPRRSSVVTSREGGMATLPLDTLPQFASQSQGRRRPHSQHTQQSHSITGDSGQIASTADAKNVL